MFAWPNAIRANTFYQMPWFEPESLHNNSNYHLYSLILFDFISISHLALFKQPMEISKRQVHTNFSTGYRGLSLRLAPDRASRTYRKWAFCVLQKTRFIFVLVISSMRFVEVAENLSSVSLVAHKIIWF